MSRDGVTPPHWFIREAVQAFDLELSEVAVFVALCDHANQRTRIAWPSQRLIAEEMGMGRATVERALERLAAVGLVEIAEPVQARRSTRYRIPREMPAPAPTLPFPTRRDESQHRERGGDGRWSSGLTTRPDEDREANESGLTTVPDVESIWPHGEDVSSTSAPRRHDTRYEASLSEAEGGDNDADTFAADEGWWDALSLAVASAEPSGGDDDYHWLTTDPAQSRPTRPPRSCLICGDPDCHDDCDPYAMRRPPRLRRYAVACHRVSERTPA